MAELEGFTPLKMTENPEGVPKPRGASRVDLERADGTGFWVEKGHTDKDDGIVDADFEGFPPDEGD